MVPAPAAHRRDAEFTHEPATGRGFPYAGSARIEMLAANVADERRRADLRRFCTWIKEISVNRKAQCQTISLDSVSAHRWAINGSTSATCTHSNRPPTRTEP